MERKFSLKEFKPASLFILKFLSIYITGNILYGLFITYFEPRADPVTISVTKQVAFILNLIDPPVTTLVHESIPTVKVRQNGSVLSVFEGCNGINVAVVFCAFIVAYGPASKNMFWVIPSGVIIIHLSNLLRIGLLFFVSKNYPHNLYFLHKYFFSAFIYMVVFALWFGWISISQHNSRYDQTRKITHP